MATAPESVEQATFATAAPAIPDQHSLPKSLALHLVPGILYGLFYYLLALPLAARAGFGNMWALNLGVLFVVLPVQMGYLLYQGKLRNGSFSLNGIVLFREKTPVTRLAPIVGGLMLWGAVMVVALGGLNDWVLHHFFTWLPRAYLLSWDASGQTHSAKLMALIEGLVLGGIVAPVVQECYFRGFLLPRIARYGVWGVVLNAALFSLYHVWAPWQFVSRLLFLTPQIYAVWRTRDLRIGIWFHCFGNILAVLGALIPELLNFN
jgi:hypothetical protein